MVKDINNIYHNYSNVLLCRTDRIGDLILSTPVISAVKQHFPKLNIHFLAASYTAPLIEDFPQLKKVWIKEDFPSFRKKVKFLKQNCFDIIIFLFPVPDWAFAAFFAGIPVRIGTGYRFYSIFFNRRVYVHRKQGDRHEADLNMELLRPMGINNGSVAFNLSIPRDITKGVDKLLAQKNLQKPFVVLHPGSGGSALDWPVIKFAQLADLIEKKLGLPVVFSGSANETDLIDVVEKNTVGQHIRLDGKFELKQFAAFLKKAKLVVANSTGPLHIANAMGTDVVGLYCPDKSCHPNRWGPYNNQDSVIMPQVDNCVYCKKSKCKQYNCMELISVEQVFNKIEMKINLTR